MNIGNELGTILALYGVLFAFGTVYNQAVSYLTQHGYDEGYLAFIVAFGVAVTLGAVALVDWQFALLTLGAFIASGTPMIIGSVVRYVRSRNASQRQLTREALHRD